MTRFGFIQKFGEQNKLAVAMSTPESRIITSNTPKPFYKFVHVRFNWSGKKHALRKDVFTAAQHQTAGHSYYKGYFSPESFGSYQDVMDALRKPVSSYSLLYEHPTVHKSSSISSLKRKREFSTENSNKKNKAIVKATPKYKPAKKNGEDNNTRFPKNVKYLMETGMFDGVLVDYVSFSKGKLLRATIQRNLYLCGCDLCHNTKTFSASELEKHALGGSKTSHPNNHIRFENGKTMHEVVKHLQSIEEDNMLFDALQTVTGSPINLEAFSAWKEKYLS